MQPTTTTAALLHENTKSNGSNVAAIAIGCTVGVLLVALAALRYHKRREQTKKLVASQAQIAAKHVDTEKENNPLASTRASDSGGKDWTQPVGGTGLKGLAGTALNVRAAKTYDARSEPEAPMPSGWRSAKDPNTGKEYYYNKQGECTWVRPTEEVIVTAAQNARRIV